MGGARRRRGPSVFLRRAERVPRLIGARVYARTDAAFVCTRVRVCTYARTRSHFSRCLPGPPAGARQKRSIARRHSDAKFRSVFISGPRRQLKKGKVGSRAPSSRKFRADRLIERRQFKNSDPPNARRLGAVDHQAFIVRGGRAREESARPVLLAVITASAESPIDRR